MNEKVCKSAFYLIVHVCFHVLYSASEEKDICLKQEIMWIGYCKEIKKLTFRALALSRSESRNCGLHVVYIQKDGAKLFVGTW